MKRQAREVFRWWLLSALLVLLAACASGGPLVTPGRTTAGGDLSIDAGMEWTRMGGIREQLWTIDGPQLNSLHLISSVREREFIFLGERQTQRQPQWRAARSLQRTVATPAVLRHARQRAAPAHAIEAVAKPGRFHAPGIDLQFALRGVGGPMQAHDDMIQLHARRADAIDARGRRARLYRQRSQGHQQQR